jgi:hypothetical protein
MSTSTNSVPSAYLPTLTTFRWDESHLMFAASLGGGAVEIYWTPINRSSFPHWFDTITNARAFIEARTLRFSSPDHELIIEQEEGDRYCLSGCMRHSLTGSKVSLMVNLQSFEIIKAGLQQCITETESRIEREERDREIQEEAQLFISEVRNVRTDEGCNDLSPLSPLSMKEEEEEEEEEKNEDMVGLHGHCIYCNINYDGFGVQVHRETYLGRIIKSFCSMGCLSSWIVKIYPPDKSSLEEDEPQSSPAVAIEGEKEEDRRVVDGNSSLAEEKYDEMYNRVLYQANRDRL